jgi:hypothetical protein
MNQALYAHMNNKRKRKKKKRNPQPRLDCCPGWALSRNNLSTPEARNLNPQMKLLHLDAACY